MRAVAERRKPISPHIAGGLEENPTGGDITCRSIEGGGPKSLCVHSVETVYAAPIVI